MLRNGFGLVMRSRSYFHPPLAPPIKGGEKIRMPFNLVESTRVLPALLPGAERARFDRFFHADPSDKKLMVEMRTIKVAQIQFICQYMNFKINSPLWA
jgi:hypothetical protein